MGLVAFCWLIVELHVIPNGFLKWFYLSFYIHPFFLVFCQIILWLKQLQKWLLLLYFLPFRIARLFISVFFTKRVAATFITMSTDNEVYYDAIGPEISTLVEGSKIVLHSRWILRTQVGRSKFDSSISESNVFEHGPFEAAQETDVHDDNYCRCRSSWLYEYLYSDHYTCTMTTYYESSPDASPQIAYPQLHEVKGPFVSSFGPEKSEDSEISFHDQSSDKKPLTHVTNTANASSSSNTNILPPPTGGLIHQSTRRTVQDTPVDMFFKHYIQRMRFYTFLYRERLCGMKAILCEHSTVPALFMRNQSINVSESRKRLLKSLECEFELTCVAQVCLSWEALHYQYWIFEALTLPNDPQFSSIHPNVSDIFQEFKILLEKFMEDEKSKGQRYSDYLHARISFQSLLQVPDVTGFIVKEENNSMAGEAIAPCPSHVLGAIEKCIKTLFLYIKADNKRKLRKNNGIFMSSNPSVEDPGDLELLYQVTKSLQKKMKLLADPQAKNKRWLKRHLKPPQRKDDLLFAMIDIQLVQRLLKMPVVSSSHLKWCQEKLNNLEIREGKLFRASTSHLFPIS